jgi:hypothetical protein
MDLLSLPASLLKDAVLCPRGQIIVRFSRYRHPAGLGRMLELAMTTTGRDQVPAVVSESLQYLADLH